jgi:hypothetical protein
MTYMQLKGGAKLHLVFEAEGHLSRPICGQHWNGTYRMTSNVPLAHSCNNCRRVFHANEGRKIRREFFNAILKEPTP